METTGLCLLLGVVLLGFACFAYRQPRAGDRVAYWHQSIPGLDESPDRFYAQVYQAIKEGLAFGADLSADLHADSRTESEQKEVALSGFGFGSHRLFETRTIFSHRPLYLVARYRHLTYYLYVGQTPAGTFLSTSLYSKYLKGEGEPRLANWAAYRYFLRQTIFQYDAALMFQESVHAIVLEVLDLYISEQGLKPLEAYERRPIYHAFYNSAFPQTAFPQATLPQAAFPQALQPQMAQPQMAQPQFAPQPFTPQPFAAQQSASHQSIPQPNVPQGVPFDGSVPFNPTFYNPATDAPTGEGELKADAYGPEAGAV